MSVLETIRRESRRLTALATAAGALLPMAVGLLVLTAAAAWLSGGQWLTLPRALPMLAWVVGLGAAFALGDFVRRRLRARAAPAAVAAAIEKEQGLRRGALTGLLEVADAGIFAEHAAERMGNELRAAAERPAPRLRRRIRRAALLSVVALAQVLALAGTSWARRADGWRALLNPVDAWRGALVEPLRIAEHPPRVLRGASVPFVVDAPGRTRVALRWRATGGAWVESQLAVEADGRGHGFVPTADADLVIHVSDGRAGHDSVTVLVVDRPFVGDVSVVARYPAYLDRANERLPADAPVRVPVGTQLDVVGSASEPLASALLRGEGGDVALRTDGTRFSGAFTPRRTGAWRWEVRGVSQAIDDVPPVLDVEVLDDSLPRVEILAPTGEVFVDPRGRVVLDLLAQDDHALTRVALRVQDVDRVLSERREALWSGAASVEIVDFALSPGQSITVRLVAYDAAPGNRESVSAPLLLRIPTAEEAREAARAAADLAVTAADAAARAQAELAERTATESRSRADRSGAGGREEANRADSRSTAERLAGANREGDARGGDARQDPNAARENLGYEGAERARDIAGEQRELAEQVQRLEDAARELEDRLRRAGALDTALARQLQDAQRLLREAMTPELMAALQRLENSTQQLDAARTRQSLADLAAQQQRLRETLERSAELLRRAALEGQMQTLADRGRELADHQRALADSARTDAPVGEQVRAMEQETRDLARQAEQLSQRLDAANAKPGAESTADAAQAAQDAADALGQMSQDRGAGERAAEAMERAAESLAEARGRQVGEWKAELTDALDRSVQELVQLAREQDALADQARQQTNADLRGTQSALQQGVQAAQERLADEGRRTTLVSPRSQEMMERARQRSAQASRESAEGRRGQAEQAMREAADALRQAAAQLTRDRERATGSQSATGLPELLQELQRLGQQQGGLNSQMQNLLQLAQQQAGAQGMDAATQEQARQLARSQREIARQLDGVADADPTGRAQELAREARALAMALDQGAVDPATKARQEQLLRRMLDAGRSLEQDQRDERARREARAARGTERFAPTGEVEGTPAERYRVPTWAELRGLSAEDRRLVIEYFRRLNAAGRP